MLTDVLWLIAAGLVSGYASGLLGIGGGLIRMPIFLYLMPLLGVPHALLMHVAAGTSLSVAVPSSIAASRSQHRAGNLHGRLLRTWLPALGVGVAFGILGAGILSGRVLEVMFASLIFGLAIRMLLPHSRGGTSDQVPSDQQPSDRPPGDDSPTPEDISASRAAISPSSEYNPSARDAEAHLPSRPVLSILALLIGALSPMLGITGGVFTTPTLTHFRYPIHWAVAVSSVGCALVSVLGTIGFVVAGWHAMEPPWRFVGYVDLLALVVMTPCVLITAPLGVWTANRIGHRTLERLFGLLLLIVSLNVAWKALFAHGS